MTDSTNLASDRELVRSLIRDVPDFPSPGVVFRDVAGVLGDGAGFQAAIRGLATVASQLGEFDLVAGMEARGFMFGAPLATLLGVGFVPVRKAGKLPPPVLGATYELEYGSATVEMHTDAVGEGERVVLIDDLIATGGTMMAGKKLLEKLGATVTEGAAIVDLPELGGSARLRASGLPLYTLVDFDGH